MDAPTPNRIDAVTDAPSPSVALADPASAFAAGVGGSSAPAEPPITFDSSPPRTRRDSWWARLIRFAFP